MTDVRNTGYQAEAQSVTFSGTQTLASLADNEFTDLSDEIDNSTNGYMFADFEIALGAAIWDGTDAAVELYIVPSVDGTNYPDWTGNVTTDEQENAQYFVGAGTIRDEDGSATARAAVRGIEIPPGKYKVGVRNRANVAFAASGNTVKWRPWGYKSA